MKKISTLIFLFFLSSVALGQEGSFERDDCATITAPVATKTWCKAKTTVGVFTAGREYRWTGSVWENMDTDNQTITIAKSIILLDPVVAHTNRAQIYWPGGITLQRIACSTDTGTVSINFDERVEATPNMIGTDTLSAALVCDSDSQVTTAFSDAVIAADVPHNLQITATTGAPTTVRIHLKAVLN